MESWVASVRMSTQQVAQSVAAVGTPQHGGRSTAMMQHLVETRLLVLMA